MARRIILALALLPLMLAGLAAARAEGPPVVHPAAPLAPDFIRSLAPVPVLPQASPEVNAGDPQQAIPKAASSPEARVAVLIYHDVHPHPDNPYTVTPERLGADLQWFLDHGWRALTLRQFADWMGGDLHLAGDWFLLTFDDGYRGWADHGYPVLQERGVPAVQFALTGRLGYGGGPEGPPIMTAGQVRAIASGGLVTFACHTYDLHREVGGRPRVKQVCDREQLSVLFAPR